MKECKKSGQLSNPHFHNVDNTTFLLVSCGCGHRHSETIQYQMLDCHKRSFFHILAGYRYSTNAPHLAHCFHLPFLKFPSSL